jgi:TonB family protein
MDGKKYSFKDVFSLRIRLCLLAVILIFIFGFLFSPRVKIKREQPDPGDHPFIIIPDPTEEVVNIAELPTNDLSEILDKKSYDDKKIENKVNVTTNIPFKNHKKPDVGFGIPVFIPHDKEPEPLNLDEVNFEYPESMKMLGISGIIYLQLLIDEKGNVRNIVQMNSVHPALDKVAVRNAWKIKFSPAEQRDKPVAVWYAFWVEFKLK